MGISTVNGCMAINAKWISKMRIAYATNDYSFSANGKGMMETATSQTITENGNALAEKQEQAEEGRCGKHQTRPRGSE